MRKCPWCKETVAVKQRNLAACPFCGRSWLPGDPGLQVLNARRIAEIIERQTLRYRRLVGYGSAVVAALFLLAPVFHIGVSPLVVVPLLVLAHSLVIRYFLVAKARRVLSRTRRMFVRWITRLVLLWAGSLGYGFTVLPVVGVVCGVATFAGLTSIVHAYTVWSLRREQADAPLTGWEKLVLGLLAGMTVLVLAGLLLAALLLGWTVNQLVNLLSGS
ncbi:MAG: hypothetical protein JXQ27_02380 [Acidobacteria bacterium]|nr:hypothetical protein [Acidobacteriota bacterium]